MFTDDILHTDRGQSLNRQAFAAMHSGRTRTKFKMLVDPHTKKVYWLMRRGRGEALPYGEGQSPYQELVVQPTTIYSYRLRDDKKKEYAKPFAPLGGNFRIKTMKLQSGPQRNPETELSWRQVYELDTMIATQSHWWPLEGLAWKAKEYFAWADFHVLFDGPFPVGMVVTENEQTTAGARVTITMLGLLAAFKGQGLGKMLIQYALCRALQEKHAAEIVLHTSDQDRQQGRATKEWYEKLGFEKTGKTINDPAAIIAAAVERGELAKVDLFNSYLSDAYSKLPCGRSAERYTQEAITERLRRVFSEERTR